MTNFIKENKEEIFSSTFNLSNQAIYLMHKDGRILFANKNALNGLGYTLNEMENLYVWDVDAVVDSKEKYLNQVKNFNKIDSPDFLPNTIQSNHKRKNGEIFPVEIVSRFITIKESEYLLSYVKDITERVKKAEDLELYFELIDSSKDMIFLVDHATAEIEFVNDSVCKNLGYSFEELKNMKVTDFRRAFKDLDNIEIPEVFKKIEELNSMTTFGIYITKDGNKIPVETSLHRKEYQEKSFVIAISRDISERLEIEKEKEELNKKIKNYNKTLQNEISIAKEELIEYENIMKRQSKMAAMGEMLENIAHQWRQPLSAISVLSTGMILQNDENILSKEDLNKGLSDINDRVQYLSKTIDDFRNYFKPNKQKNYFDLSHLIKTSIKLSNVKHDKENIEFIVNCENIELYTYENEFLQVLLNLIGNAKYELTKSTLEKYIVIETKVEDTYIIISVSDNAGGIPENIMHRIFEPYFTTKHNYEGTGIGLFMSQNILKHMAGSIEVKNIEVVHNNKQYTGASFEIKIPYKI